MTAKGIEVHVINRQRVLTIAPLAVRCLVREVLSSEGAECDEVNIHLVGTRAISELHARFFDDPTTTDCITFPLDCTSPVGPRLLGDVFVCPATAVTYATANSADPYREATLYIIHGLLHLLGYDDLEPVARRLMRQAERRCMKRLDSNGLVLRKNT